MKRIFKLLTLLFVCMPVIVSAGSVTATPTKINLKEGETKKITVKANSAAGRVSVSSSNTSIATAKGTTFLDNSSWTFSIKAVKEGNTKVIVKLVDVAGYDGKDLSGKSIAINVTVTSKTTKKTTTTTKKTTTTTKKISGTTKKTSTTTKKTTSGKTNTGIVTTTKKVTTLNPGVPVTTKKKELIIDDLQIVGYDINFNKKDVIYTIVVEENVNEVFVIANANKKLNNTGLVNIQDKDFFIISSDTDSQGIKIQIKRKRTKNKEDDYSMYVGVIAILGILIILLLLEPKRGR